MTLIPVYFCDPASPDPGARTRTRMARYDNTFRKEQTWAFIPANTSLWSPRNSISDEYNSSDGRAHWNT